MNNKNKDFQRGFTFTELAISMVIIGLLIVSILAGQNLIRASKIRAIANETANFQTAYNTFFQTYGGIPGDIVDITVQISNTGAWYNGTGEGDIIWAEGVNNCKDTAAVALNCSEGAQAWRHLFIAGLITGPYSGTVTSDFADIGVNVPASKYGIGGYSFDYTATADVNGNSISNHLQLGTESVGTSTKGIMLSPINARDVDTKIDDGMPNTGKVLSSGLANCQSGAIETSTYKLDEGDTLRCALLIRM